MYGNIRIVMKFSDSSPLAILRECTVMYIPQVTLQFFLSSYGRQKKSEFENDDIITGIGFRWTISTIMGFSVGLIWNLKDLTLKGLGGGHFDPPQVLSGKLKNELRFFNEILDIPSL